MLPHKSDHLAKGETARNPLLFSQSLQDSSLAELAPTSTNTDSAEVKSLAIFLAF